jgi:hypothetical protein
VPEYPLASVYVGTVTSPFPCSIGNEQAAYLTRSLRCDHDFNGIPFVAAKSMISPRRGQHNCFNSPASVALTEGSGAD